MKNLLLAVSFTLLQLSLGGLTQAADCEHLLASVQAASTAGDRANAIGALVKLGDNPVCFAEIVGIERKSYPAFIKQLETVRTDKQAGSSVGTGGTTSLVSKGVTAQAISIAAEYGALTESVNNQVVTVQGSLDGIPAALVRQGLLRYCVPGIAANPCPQEELFSFLRRVSYSVSFNTSQNSQAISGDRDRHSAGNCPARHFHSNRPSSFRDHRTLYPLECEGRNVPVRFQTTWRNALTAPSGNPSPSQLETAGAGLLSGLQSFIPLRHPMSYTRTGQVRAAKALAGDTQPEHRVRLDIPVPGSSRISSGAKTPNCNVGTSQRHFQRMSWPTIPTPSLPSMPQTISRQVRVTVTRKTRLWPLLPTSLS